jgi:hypothetical protein
LKKEGELFRANDARHSQDGYCRNGADEEDAAEDFMSDSDG